MALMRIERAWDKKPHDFVNVELNFYVPTYFYTLSSRNLLNSVNGGNKLTLVGSNIRQNGDGSIESTIQNTSSYAEASLSATGVSGTESFAVLFKYKLDTVSASRGIFSVGQTELSAAPYMLIRQNTANTIAFYVNNGYKYTSPVLNTNQEYVLGLNYNEYTDLWTFTINGNIVGTHGTALNLYASNANNIYLLSGFGGNATGKINGVKIWRNKTIPDAVFRAEALDFYRSIEPDTLYIPTAAGGVSGTLAVSLDSITAAFSGVVEVTGTLSTALDSITVAASGTFTPSSYTGTLAVTLESIIVAMSGTSSSTAVTGSMAATLADIQAAMSGVVEVTGTLSSTLDSIAAAFSGSVVNQASGTFNITLDGITFTATGSMGGWVIQAKDSTSWSEETKDATIWTIQ